MRKDVIFLLAATSSIFGVAAGEARETIDLHAREITRYMIIWHVCIAPRSGSALSIYSRTGGPMRSLHDVAMQEDVCVGCADYAQEARNENSAGGHRSADPQETDSTWNACDADGSDEARRLTGRPRA